MPLLIYNDKQSSFEGLLGNNNSIVKHRRNLEHVLWKSMKFLKV